VFWAPERGTPFMTPQSSKIENKNNLLMGEIDIKLLLLLQCTGTTQNGKAVQNTQTRE